MREQGPVTQARCKAMRLMLERNLRRLPATEAAATIVQIAQEGLLARLVREFVLK
ncbi:hypothetical protein D3C72_2494010 [compost metagenome]